MKKCITFLFALLIFHLNAQDKQSSQLKEQNSPKSYEQIKTEFNTKWSNYSDIEKQTNQRELKKFGRFSWFWDSRILPDQTFEDYQKNWAKSYHQNQNLLGYDLDFDDDYSSGIWKPLGPNNHTGATNGSTGGVGRIKDLAFHPTYHGQFYDYGYEPPYTGHNTIYAGGDIGGLWISKNGGQDWENMNTDFLPNLSVKGIAQSRLNYQEIFFGASSNPHLTENIAHNSMIVYRTLDHGGSWSACGHPFDDEDLSDNLLLNDILIHPKTWVAKDGDPAIKTPKLTSSETDSRDEKPDTYAVFVTAEDGLYRSTNKGATWIKTWSNNIGNSPYFIGGPMKIHIPPTGINEMYLTGYTHNSQGPDHSIPNIYRSTNYGVDWSPWVNIDVGNGNGGSQNHVIHIGLDENSPYFDDFKVTGTNMAISHQNSFKKFVLVNITYKGSESNFTISGYNFGTGNLSTKQFLFYTEDDGISWQSTISGSSQFYSVFKNANCFAIDPLDDTRLYFARVTGGTSNIFIIRDSNGASQVASQSGFTIGMHPDPRTLVFHKEYENDALTLLCGTDGGINITENPGANSPSWLNITGNDLTVSQIYKHASAQTDNDMIVSGFQDIGSNFKETSSNYSWTHVSGGDGMDCAIDPTNHNHFITSSQEGGGPYVFTNGSSGASTINNPPGSTAGYWVSPMAFSEGDPDKFYFAKKDLWMHPNKASNNTEWVNLTQGAGIQYTGSHPFITVFDISKSNPDHIIIGVYGHYQPANRLYKTTDGGVNWSPMPTNDSNGTMLPQNRWISDIEFDPTNANNICISFAGFSETTKIYRSTNGGTTWTTWQNGLPAGGVNCLETDIKTGFIYAGTDYGVYRRKSTQSTWLKYGAGLPNVIVTDIDVQVSNHHIRASTYGRGLWQSRLGKYKSTKAPRNQKSESEDDANSIILGPNPTTSEIFTKFELTKKSFVDISIVENLTGQEIIKVIENYLLPEGKHSYQVDVSKLSTGTYYITYHIDGVRTIKPFVKY